MQIIKNDSKSFHSQIPENGRFRLELDYNSSFTLIFKKKNHQSKTIQINTAVPEDVLLRPENITNFLMTVNLFEGDEQTKDQTQQIVYYPKYNCFGRIPTYLDQEIVDKGNQKSNNQPNANKSEIQPSKVF